MSHTRGHYGVGELSVRLFPLTGGQTEGVLLLVETRSCAGLTKEPFLAGVGVSGGVSCLQQEDQEITSPGGHWQALGFPGEALEDLGGGGFSAGAAIIESTSISGANCY